MIRNVVARFLWAALIVVGCGSCGGNNTNGSLGLAVTSTDLTGGNFNVVAQAVYTPPTGSSANNVPITISTHTHNLSGTLSSVDTQSLNADSTGTVTKSYTIAQSTETLYVDVTASTGGLSITKSVSIAAPSPLTTSPTSVAFASGSPALTTQQISISGGTAPYQASIDTSHAADFSPVSVNGTTITLVLANNSGATATQALLTVTDNKGNSVIVPVSYFK